MIIFPGGIIGGRKRASLIYNGRVASASGTSTTHTYNNVPLGPEDPSRELLLSFASGLTTGPTAITVNGNAATLVRDGSSNSVGGIGIWRFSIPTGSTATVVRTFANSSSAALNPLYSASAYNLLSLTPTGVNSNRVLNAGPAASNVNVLKNGIIIGVTSDNNSVSSSWSGLTVAEIFDPTLANTSTFAFDQLQPAATPRAISFTAPSATTLNIVTAAFA